MMESGMKYRNGFDDKNTILPAALTIGAALGILVISLAPPLIFKDSRFFVPGLIPHLIANALLCILLCVWINITGITIRVVMHVALMIVSAFAILVLSVIPPLVFSNGELIGSGIIPHIIAYGILCIMSCIWFYVAGISSYPVLASVLICIIYGCVVECIQFVVPYRTFELSDILVNCAAVLAFALPAKLIIQYLPFNRRSASACG